MLLSNKPEWNARLLQPRQGHCRVYHAQVDGMADQAALGELRAGMNLPDFTTLPCEARLLEPAPDHPPRVPPVRERKSNQTSGIELAPGQWRLLGSDKQALLLH